jgi:hypothetical protein
MVREDSLGKEEKMKKPQCINKGKEVFHEELKVNVSKVKCYNYEIVEHLTNLTQRKGKS